MGSATRDRNLKIAAWSALAAMTIVRLIYAGTRDVFLSGPDANGFIAAAKGFAQQEFFVEEVNFQPQYPPGYPFILSLIIRLFGYDTSLQFSWKLEAWMFAVQIAQVLALCIATIIFKSILNKWEPKLNSTEQFMLTLIFILHPGLSVSSVEAMYEIPFLFFVLLAIHQLMVLDSAKCNRKTWRFIEIGAIIGVAITIHPRALVFFFLAIVFSWVKKKLTFRDLQLIFFSGIWIPFLFCMRNLNVYNHFTLSYPGAWLALQSQEFLGGCVSLNCIFVRVFENPLGYLNQISHNAAYFWAPYSGGLTRGTWYHNVSFQSVMERIGWNNLAVSFSLVFSIVNFAFFLLGSKTLWRNRNFFGMVFIICVLSSFLTDVLVYGDSRHRLVCAPFILLINYIGLLQLKEWVPLRNLRGNFVKFSWKF